VLAEQILVILRRPDRLGLTLSLLDGVRLRFLVISAARPPSQQRLAGHLHERGCAADDAGRSQCALAPETSRCHITATWTYHRPTSRFWSACRL